MGEVDDDTIKFCLCWTYILGKEGGLRILNFGPPRDLLSYYGWYMNNSVKGRTLLGSWNLSVFLNASTYNQPYNQDKNLKSIAVI